MRGLSIGVIIGIILIVYWYVHDHPGVLPPAKQGSLYSVQIDV